MRPRATKNDMENIIEVRDLTKSFREVVAVDNISFDVKKGEIFAFLGPNGAGKSTTIGMLSTIITPTGGTARVNHKLKSWFR